MAGLIFQNLPAGADQEIQPGVPPGGGYGQQPNGQPPEKPAGAPVPGDDGDDGEVDLDDPTYQAALKLAMSTLYRKGAAKQLAAALRSAPTPAQGLADAAYRMTQIVDEQTGGEIPESMLGVLACQLLGEVADVAQAAGVKIDSKTIAEATRTMLEMYLDDSGADPAQTQQIRQQMAGMDPAQVGAQAEMEA